MEAGEIAALILMGTIAVLFIARLIRGLAETTVPASQLRFQRLHPDAQLPRRAHQTDGGLDLQALEPLTLEPGQRALVSTGLAVELTPGHAGLIVPRSGLAAKHGITIVNAPGLIDAGYRGELGVILLNTGTEPFEIEAGDRIAQLVVIAVELSQAAWAAQLAPGGDGRQTGGFGSSGRGS